MPNLFARATSSLLGDPPEDAGDPDAGLLLEAAEFDPSLADPLHAGHPMVGVSGVGLSLQDAFQGCTGEGIEYLSHRRPGMARWSLIQAIRPPICSRLSTSRFQIRTGSVQPVQNGQC
jgi:hypothetical protein